MHVDTAVTKCSLTEQTASIQLRCRLSRKINFARNCWQLLLSCKPHLLCTKNWQFWVKDYLTCYSYLFPSQVWVETLKSYSLFWHVGLSEPYCVVLSFLCVYFWPCALSAPRACTRLLPISLIVSLVSTDYVEFHRVWGFFCWLHVFKYWESQDKRNLSEAERLGHPYNKADIRGFDPKKETSLAATKQLKLLLRFSCCDTVQRGHCLFLRRCSTSILCQLWSVKTCERPEGSDYGQEHKMMLYCHVLFLYSCLQPDPPQTINWKFRMV